MRAARGRSDSGCRSPALLAWFALRDRSFWSFDNLLAGLGIGGIIVAVWFVSGHIGYVEEHPQTLEQAFLRTNSRQMESLSFVAPVAWTLDYLMFASDANKELTIGIVAVLGMLLGSTVYALATGRFRWEGFRDTEDTANHLVGAALMGFGGVTAVGCTIGQGLSGVSTLSAGSFIALVEHRRGRDLGDSLPGVADRPHCWLGRALRLGVGTDDLRGAPKRTMLGIDPPRAAAQH